MIARKLLQYAAVYRTYDENRGWEDRMRDGMQDGWGEGRLEREENFQGAGSF